MYVVLLNLLYAQFEAVLPELLDFLHGAAESVDILEISDLSCKETARNLKSENISAQ